MLFRGGAGAECEADGVYKLSSEAFFRLAVDKDGKADGYAGKSARVPLSVTVRLSGGPAMFSIIGGSTFFTGFLLFNAATRLS